MFTKNATPHFAYSMYGNNEVLRLENCDIIDIKGRNVKETFLSLYPGLSGKTAFTYSTHLCEERISALIGRQMASDYWNYIETLLANTSPTAVNNANYCLGFVFGDGNTAPTVDDYMLSGNAVLGYNYTVTVEVIYGDEYIDYQYFYTITNTSDEAITIGEVGVFGELVLYPASGSAKYTNYMIERTAFDTPITIEPDGVGQVTYTLRMVKRI